MDQKVETPTTQTTDKVETPVVETPKVEAPETKVDSQETPKSLMDEATAEEKDAQAAEDKRLLDAKPEDLNAEDKVKREALVKVQDEAAKADVVPEKYEIKVPEGMTLDQGLLDKITPIFKEAKINQATAQKLADAYSDVIKGQAKTTQDAQTANFTKFVEDLRAETIKELGSNYKEQLAFAAKARDKFMSKELVEKLNLSGLANDKDVIKHLINLGKTISEGKFVEGKTAGVEEKNPLATLYPKTPPK